MSGEAPDHAPSAGDLGRRQADAEPLRPNTTDCLKCATGRLHDPPDCHVHFPFLIRGYADRTGSVDRNLHSSRRRRGRETLFRRSWR